MARPPSVVPPVLASVMPPQPSPVSSIDINTPQLAVMAQPLSAVPPVLACIVQPQLSPTPAININTPLLTVMVQPQSIVPSALASEVPLQPSSPAPAININTALMTVMAQPPSVVPPVPASVVQPHSSSSSAININTLLLASACSGYLNGLNILLNGENASGEQELPFDLQAAYTSGSSTVQLAPKELLKGVTFEGDTALHAVATNGDSDNFLSCANLIYSKSEHDILFVKNKRGDTPLHLAARARNHKMVSCLIDLTYENILGIGRFTTTDEAPTARLKRLLRMENNLKETVLHEAVRIGCSPMVDLLTYENGLGIGRFTTTKYAPAARLKRLLRIGNNLDEVVRVGSDNMVRLLMEKDRELARFPEKGTSPLYLAISLGNKIIATSLYEMSSGFLSYSGPNGQNALHAAVGTCPDLSELLLEWNKALTTERDKNGSTPLHFAAGRFQELAVCQQVLEANPAALYQSDNDGLFPVHVAASVGAYMNVTMFLKRYPGNAGLLDAKGRTFLHVAAEKQRVMVVRFACENVSLSWILNIRDKDGNTALHLAVQEGSLGTVCTLLMSLHVQLNLTNNKVHTPLDISEYKIPTGMLFAQTSGVYIRRTLGIIGARHGASRKDHKNYEDSKGPDQMIRDSKESESTKESNQLERIKDTGSSKESERIKEATQSMSIGSVLIATVTFGATFALPGGYRADDHENGGSPTRAGRYAFDAFMMANTLSFICSVIATIGFMFSGSSMFDLVSRRIYLALSKSLMRTSVSSLITAFALGVYLVLAPVARKTATVICILSSLVVLASEVELWAKTHLMLRPLRKRKGLLWTTVPIGRVIMLQTLFVFWPIILSFGWAAIARTHSS